MQYYIHSETKGPKFGPLLFSPLKSFKTYAILYSLRNQGSEIRTLTFQSAKDMQNTMLHLYRNQASILLDTDIAIIVKNAVPCNKHYVCHRMLIELRVQQSSRLRPRFS